MITQSDIVSYLRERNIPITTLTATDFINYIYNFEKLRRKSHKEGPTFDPVILEYLDKLNIPVNEFHYFKKKSYYLTITFKYKFWIKWITEIRNKIDEEMIVKFP